ncbi:MAG: hypothetical protein V3V49_05590, partial [Candidatus Krumholzibacteria bacterium]
VTESVSGTFQSTGRKPGGGGWGTDRQTRSVPHPSLREEWGTRRLAPAALTRRIHPAESVTDPLAYH